ncbi:hypothetical protein EDC94DRAFT_660337 [Helicostylum pulchrum]|nr:hypothetical protein EDC94DRAFT_660337 [Helicostylum pulchrum]
MAELSNRKKSMIQNLRKARDVAKIINVDNIQPVEIVEETTVQSVNSTLKDNGISRKTPFSRGLEYTARYQPTITEEEPSVSELEKLKNAYEVLSLELIPQINSDNNTLGKNSFYERTKYQAVQTYFRLRIEGIKKMDASETAAKTFWHGKPIAYRSRMIRENATSYLETGKIAECAQGKHSKRTSVLDDNDNETSVAFRTSSASSSFLLQLTTAA